MGYDLTSDSGSQVRFRGAAWALILNLAECYGWRPLGTSAAADHDEPHAWGGDYDSNDGQRVLAHDAEAMAQALTAALADPLLRQRQGAISRELDRTLHAMEVEVFGDEEIGPYVEDEEPLVVPDDALQATIAFLRLGSFRID